MYLKYVQNYIINFFLSALSSCASTMPMKTYSSSLFSTFLSWNRRNTHVRESTGNTCHLLTTKIFWISLE